MEIKELFKKCEKLYDRDNYTETIETCDEILAISKDDHKALGYKTFSLYYLNRYDEALDILNHALSVYPKNYRYLYLKALILMDLKEFDASIQCFDELFKLKGFDKAFMKQDYDVCCSFKVDYLIEEEKYAEAFRFYLSKNSRHSTYRQSFGEFRRLVRKNVKSNKRLSYDVMSSPELIEFLKSSGFTPVCDLEDDPVISVDILRRIFSKSSGGEAISLSKFLDKVNFYPRNEVVWEKLYTDDGKLLYEGFTKYGYPYGLGTLYFENGNIYRQGIFDTKGIVQGSEYYPSGQLRFEGEWSITYGYGPNAPREGKYYAEDGEMIFSGKFQIKRGGVGWPMIQHPKGFRIKQKDSPDVKYFKGFE